MLGTRIAALRRSADMSQAELAKVLRVSPSAVGMYEQGRREPDGDTLVQLAKVFHVSTDYLLTGQTSSLADQQVLQQLLERWVSITDSRLELRPGQVFTRQELAVLFLALLLEP